jgi:hypothetical protein
MTYGVKVVRMGLSQTFTARGAWRRTGDDSLRYTLSHAIVCIVCNGNVGEFNLDLWPMGE